MAEFSPSSMGEVRAHPETGYRQVLVKAGRGGSKWVDKAEPRNDALPGGGILHKGFRKHIDDLKGNIGHLEEALGENSAEAKRIVTGELIAADPKRQEAVKKSNDAIESSWEDKRPGARRAPKTTGNAVQKATTNGLEAKAKSQPPTGSELFEGLGKHLSDMRDHLSSTSRASAVSSGIGHVWDTAAGHLRNALVHFNLADNYRKARDGYKSLPHLANAALFLHHAVESLKGTTLVHPTLDTDATAFYKKETQRHATRSGRGDVV